MQMVILLINGTKPYWQKLLEEALAPLGTVQAASEEEGLELILCQSYELIIVDATTIKNVPVLVARIRAQQPNVRIVVASASPTWRRAREAFRAGATDYIPKSLNKQELLATFKNILAKVPPPWLS